MLDKITEKHKIDMPYMLRKGTVAVLTTFLAGTLFGKKNTMLAFVIVLGSSMLERQDLRIKTVYKILRLIIIDTAIVCISFIASQNVYSGIPINLVVLFMMIYTNVSPYDQVSYKTFMMLYVFTQYASIPLQELPTRILMVIFTILSICITTLMHQRRNKSLLDEHIGLAFNLLNKQLAHIRAGDFDRQVEEECAKLMNKLAYTIYITAYKKYFTTHLGRIQFNFYMNIGYLNTFLRQVDKAYKEGAFKASELEALVSVTEYIVMYFKRELKLEELIKSIDEFINKNKDKEGFNKEVVEVIQALSKNFKEVEGLSYKNKNKVYREWEKSDLDQLSRAFKAYFKPRSISFNFAARMAVILTIALFLAKILGFYKMIWAIIPIMSITQPYYEDTMKRTKERIRSNIVASLCVGVMLNVVHIEWVTILLLILTFYLVYAFKDYYRMSFFIAILSMCMSSFTSPINVLVFYRIMYVIVGATIVELGNRLKPYRIEDGIKELEEEINALNKILEEESVASLENKENLHRVRDTLIHLALLCEKLYIKNTQYKNEKISQLIRTNTEFMVKIGYKLLRD